MAKLSRGSRTTSARPKSATCRTIWKQRRRRCGFIWRLFQYGNLTLAHAFQSAALNENMNAADSVISNLVTSIQNLENTVDELKGDLERAKAEARASAGQKMHHLPPNAMTGDLKMAREERTNQRPIFQDESICQPYRKGAIHYPLNID